MWNTFNFTYLWLLENNYFTILKKMKLIICILAFETNIIKQLNELEININEYEINATYNTNNMEFELYILHAKVNSTSFLLLYLF
jgi:hypothetical protein